MGLFDDDDFYTTKVSLPRRDTWRTPDRRGRRIRSMGPLPVWLLPAVGAAILLAVLIWAFSGGEPAESEFLSAETMAVMAPPAAEGVSDDRRRSDTVVGATAKVAPTVVSIVGSHREDESEDDPKSGAMGLGSGVIFSRSGDKVRIVTNNHVVEGFTQLDVVSISGEKRRATLLGRDQITDLAVIEMDGAGIKLLAEFGDSDALQPGETAIAVGNPLGIGYAPTVTQGIISWPKRTIPVTLGKEGEFDWEMDVIQTDAAINQGNSGGALVNLEGKVVGINTMKVADMGVEGLGFAIPINQVKGVIDTLIKDQKVKRPYMGVVTQDLQAYAGTEGLKLPSDVKKGVLVLDVVGPAKDAGLKSSDVIVELDGKPVDSTLALRKYIYGHKQIGEKLQVTYYRGAKKTSVQLELEELQER
ncbi:MULTISPECIES: S1C family serine protease [Paenibacillus]|uniref:S1C family serine protease n=1 Tax=Paenibacillus TaxID=44249 RepID=UPI0022B88CBF|nr:trypsin-like peptidase domain-containing protein [Paenibacillus caseinilyticus]MCZ8524058.1 trypsin-like peptidase domain-containing protein [Paenibacillus caseinilyticus]